MKSDRRLIEQRLGPLDPERAGSISHLNSLPVSVVESARSLEDPKLARSLLVFYVTADARPYLDLFVQDVVFGTTPAAIWLRGRVLVPDVSLPDLVRKSRAALLAPIGGGFAVHILPRVEDWESRAPWIGAPAHPQPDADYRSTIPADTISLADPPTAPVSDVVVTIRRWIAGRLAMTARPRGDVETVQDLAQSASSLPPLSQWSEDARMGARGLLREWREPGREPSGISGFGGPDTWYQG